MLHFTSLFATFILTRHFRLKRKSCFLFFCATEKVGFEQMCFAVNLFSNFLVALEKTLYGKTYIHYSSYSFRILFFIVIFCFLYDYWGSQSSSPPSRKTNPQRGRPTGKVNPGVTDQGQLNHRSTKRIEWTFITEQLTFELSNYE